MSRLSTHGLLGVHRSGINGGVQGEEHGKRRRGQGQIHGRGQVRHLIKAADKIVDVVEAADVDKIVDVVKDLGGQVGAAEQGLRGIARRVGRPRLTRGALEERILNPWNGHWDSQSWNVQSRSCSKGWGQSKTSFQLLRAPVPPRRQGKVNQKCFC